MEEERWQDEIELAFEGLLGSFSGVAEDVSSTMKRKLERKIRIIVIVCELCGACY